MELSQFTDFSLRTLIFVGLCEGQTSVKAISSSYRISHHHLVKVVHRLATLGYLQTSRGRGGGVALGRPPHDIRIGDVVRHVENLDLVECFDPATNHCCIAPVCELKLALGRARAAFLAELDRSTLADFLEPRDALRAQLEITPPPSR